MKKILVFEKEWIFLNFNLNFNLNKYFNLKLNC